MTLGFRLNLWITLLLGLILALGTLFVIHNARRAVADETRASVSLALQLLDVAEAGSDSDRSNRLWTRLVHHIGSLETTRHLDIVMRGPGGDVVAPVNTDPGPETADAPAWFVHLVMPRPVEFRRELDGFAGSGGEIVIRANPASEITEAWRDARPLLALQFLFALLVQGLVLVTVGRAQRPLERVLAALEEIEKGDFRTRLPRFRLPELARISDKFNHMADALEREKNDNRRLARRALSIQEEERRHMARELHDELGQSISAIKALAVSIRRGAGEGAPRERRSAEAVVEIADRTYDTVKTMMHRLRPPALDELGLVPALQRMVDNWNDHHAETFCSLHTDLAFPVEDEDTRISLYRIVQECLTNVAKHAHAGRVAVDLRTLPAGNGVRERLLLNIQDDGMGLGPGRGPGGLGLRGIHDRVAALDGEMRMASDPHAGLRLRITLPLGTTAAGTPR